MAATSASETLALRTARRSQVLGLEPAVYSKLLPKDGPDVSKRTWERRALDTRRALRDLEKEKIAVQVLAALEKQAVSWENNPKLFAQGP